VIGAHDHGGGHDHGHAHDVPARLDPVVGILSVFVAIGMIATTPRAAYGAFAGYATVAATVLALSPVPWRLLLRRLVAIAVTALLAAGPLALFDPPLGQTQATFQLLGVTLSHHGLLTLFRIWAVGSFAVAAVTWLGSVAPAHEVLSGLRRLRCPSMVVAMAGFVQRFGGVIAEEAGRMRRAMRARGHDATWAFRAVPLGGLAGTLFLRSLSRAERVHAAMLLRGYVGGGRGVVAGDYRINTRQAGLALVAIGVILAVRLVAG
jgi:cobalt/nickel transport system permease protein